MRLLSLVSQAFDLQMLGSDLGEGSLLELGQISELSVFFDDPVPQFDVAFLEALDLCDAGVDNSAGGL